MKTCAYEKCKKPFFPHPSRPLANVCSPRCATRRAQDAVKAKEAAARAERKQDREKRESFKRLSDFKAEAQRAFNAFIRERDRLAGVACISSGRPLDWSANSVDAGHYRSVGSAPHLRYNEDNCHAQSKQDNRYGAGCAVDYRLGLIERIGLDRVEALECDNRIHKWTREELTAIRDEYRAKLKALKQQR